MKKKLFLAMIVGTGLGTYDMYRYLKLHYPNDPLVLHAQNNTAMYKALWKKDWDTYEHHADLTPYFTKKTLQHCFAKKK